MLNKIKFKKMIGNELTDEMKRSEHYQNIGNRETLVSEERT